MIRHKVPSIADRFSKALPKVGLFAVFLCLLGWGIVCSQAVLGQSTYASRPLNSADDQALSANRSTPVVGQRAHVLPTVDEVPELAQRISVDLQGATLEEALDHITAKTEVRVAYLREAISTGKQVTMNQDAITAQEALRKILQGTNLRIVKATEGQLVLVSRGASTDLQSEIVPQKLPNVKRIESQEVVGDQAYLQQGTIVGTVTEASTGDPLPGVNVVIQGTQQGASTASDGTYEITDVEVGTYTVKASFVGYQNATEESVQVEEGETTEVNFELQRAAANLDEVVVVGYGQQRRREITGSVSSVDVADANVGQKASAQELIRGRVPGVNVINNSGEPGSGASVLIRGASSISAGTDPLYVVDGVPITNTNVTPQGASSGGFSASSSSNPLALINPQDIESIEVLKDAAATAIYGSEGANGVILVETKGGQSNQLRVEYGGKVSVGTMTRELDVLTGDEFRRAQSCANSLGDFSTFKGCFQQREGDFTGTSTNWQERATRNPISQEHNLSVSGGNQSTTYRGAASYLAQEGLVRNNGIERVTGRLNINHSTFSDRLQVGMNLTASYLNQNHAFYKQGGGGAAAGIIKGMIGFDPRIPVRNPNTGEYNEFSRNIKNPVALAERITDITDQKRILGNVSLDVDVLENLRASATLGVDIAEGIRRTGIPGSGPPLWVGQETNGLGRQAERTLSNVVPQATLDYDAELFGSHNLRALAGFEYERETWQAVSAQSEDFITDQILFNNLAGGAANQDLGSTKQLVEQVSFFGRVGYNIDDTYFLSATLRRDGSSVFGENQKIAWFPSASAGWDLAQESFLQGIDNLTRLRIRGSYGRTGNQGVPPLQSQAVLAPDAGFRFISGMNEETITGVAQRRAPSPNLKWEETEEINVGVDVTFGRFDGSVDVYRKTTDDLLLDVPVPPPSPAPSRLANVGKVENTGIEATLEALVLQAEDASLRLSGNVSSNRNEVLDLGGQDFIDHTTVAAQTAVFAQRLAPGHPIGAFYGPEFVRINDQGQEVYRVEGGGTTPNISEAPERFIGDPIPEIQYGLNINFRYKNFDVSTFLRGEQGREIFSNTEQEINSKSNLGQGLNVFEKTLKDGTNVGHIPKYSSRWVQDASFFRMDNITLGYSIPGTDQYGVSNVRVYGTVQNVFLITPYDGYDPEVNTNVTGRGLGFRSLARPDRGVDNKSYPTPRTFTMGAQISF